MFRKGCRPTLGVVKIQTELKFSPPVCKVVIGVGHVDEALDEVGALDEAEKHLEKTHKTDQLGKEKEEEEKVDEEEEKVDEEEEKEKEEEEKE